MASRELRSSCSKGEGRPSNRHLGTYEMAARVYSQTLWSSCCAANNPRRWALARQDEARSRRTISSVGKGPAERKRGFFVIISMPVIAAEERRSHAIERVEDAVAIALIRRHPIIVARGVGGDRKEDGVLPRRALVAQAIAPSANAIPDRQWIKAEPAVGIADEGNKVPRPPSQNAMRAKPVESAAIPDAPDIAVVKHSASVPMIDSPFGRGMRLRGRARCTCEGRDDRENPCLPAPAHCADLQTLALHE
jgi:hypothetical protein